MTMFCAVRALQPHRVDDDVEEDGEGEQRRGEPVRGEAEDRDREGGEHDAEGERLGAARCGPPGSAALRVRRIRPSMSASYHMLSAPDAPAPTAIARSAIAASTGLQRARRGDHADERREDDERHHARLQQRDDSPRRRRRHRRRELRVVSSTTAICHVRRRLSPALPATGYAAALPTDGTAAAREAAIRASSRPRPTDCWRPTRLRLNASKIP